MVAKLNLRLNYKDYQSQDPGEIECDVQVSYDEVQVPEDECDELQDPEVVKCDVSETLSKCAGGTPLAHSIERDGKLRVLALLEKCERVL